MKIGQPPEIFNFQNRVQEKQDTKQDTGNGPKDQHHPSDSKLKKQNSEETIQVQVDDEKVAAAVQDFSQELSLRMNGLQASIINSGLSAGPGLKVVLKDGTGAVVRQFTGEEFLRLKEAASKDGHARGKILDQKL